ncbi:MAG: hypothetical protein PHF66_07305, partial [Desulfobacteraceae bacterium]|nr:hypothetical protein [Desulfobacteraceae bacterium]
MNKQHYFFWSTLILFIVRFLPIINRVIDLPEMMIFIFYAVTNLALFYKTLITKTAIGFFSFFSIVSLLIIAKGFDYYWYFVPMFDIFVCYLIWSIINKKNYYKELRKLTRVALILILITSAITIPLLLINPIFVREAMSADSDNSVGTIGYSYMHSLPSLIPVFIYHIKKSKGKPRLVWLILFAIISYLILLANFGTILFISLILIPVSFFISTKRFAITIVFLILSLVVFTNDTMILNIIDTMKPFYTNTAIENKLNDIEVSIKFKSQTGQVAFRGELYNQSIDSFIENPFWGTDKSEDAGGHAYIFDFLAWFGLIGTLPLIIFYFYF